MSLLRLIKSDALEARKQRFTSAATTLTTLIGELETHAKNAGHETTDADVVTFLKKTIKNIDETLKTLELSNDSRVDKLLAEKDLLEKYLPKQLSEYELKEIIEGFIAAGCTNVGDTMKILKTQYNGQYDGAQASSILKTRFTK